MEGITFHEASLGEDKILPPPPFYAPVRNDSMYNIMLMVLFHSSYNMIQGRVEANKCTEAV